MTAPRLSPGDAFPVATLPDADDAPFDLASLRGRRSVVYVYPAASTPGCTTQACDFRDDLSSFDASGYAVVGVSPDPPAALARFRDAEGLTFPLLSDPGKQVLASWGAHGEKQLYGKTVVGVIRSTFVLDEDLRVVQASYGVRAKGHVAKLRRELGV